MHVAVVDLGYGDAGKGATVDWLCRQQPVGTVVRFNGGAQAAHNVVTPEGTHHTFAQFGSGTFAGSRTLLSRHTLVDLLALTGEGAALAGKGIDDPLSLVSIEEGALLTTPYHQAANRERERRRGTARLGSCGMGIGETMQYALTRPAPRIEDTRDEKELQRKLQQLRDDLEEELGELDVPDTGLVAEVYREIAGSVHVVPRTHLGDLLAESNVVFEGAQGVLLDEWWGFHPHTTWSTTTSENAEELAAEHGAKVLRLGVTRAYSTRHGAGPFVPGDPVLDREIPEPHNGTGEWQGAFRRGHLDLVGLRYALAVTGGVDALAITCLDLAEAAPSLSVCTGYRTPAGTLTGLPIGTREDLEGRSQLTELLKEASPVLEAPQKSWQSTISETTNAPVVSEGWGPSSTQRRGSLAALVTA